MTVAELIAELQRVPGDAPVAMLLIGSEFLEWQTDFRIQTRNDGIVVLAGEDVPEEEVDKGFRAGSGSY